MPIRPPCLTLDDVASCVYPQRWIWLATGLLLTLPLTLCLLLKLNEVPWLSISFAVALPGVVFILTGLRQVCLHDQRMHRMMFSGEGWSLLCQADQLITICKLIEDASFSNVGRKGLYSMDQACRYRRIFFNLRELNAEPQDPQALNALKQRDFQEIDRQARHLRARQDQLLASLSLNDRAHTNKQGDDRS